MRHQIIVFMYGLLALTPAMAQDTGRRDLASIRASLDREIEHILHETGIPSISMALIREGEVVWASAHGFANVGARVPATTDTYYSAGSTFKFVTATAVMQLVERGQLTLDTPLNEIVGPDLAIEGADDVTVRHLLSHHSGLDAFALARRLNPEGPVSAVPLWSRRAHISSEELLSNTRRIGPPGVAFDYSNDGYAIAGFLIEKTSGLSFDEYVASHVLQPLGVDIDRPSVPSPRVVEHMALPYELADGTPIPVAQVRYDGYAAGDVFLKASDMARFVAAQLNGGEYPGGRILNPASTEEMRRQQFEGQAYGLGVHVGSVGAHAIIDHTGSIPGFNSIMVAEPSTRQGVYIMANADHAQHALGWLAHHAMKLMWGEDLDMESSHFASKTEVTVDPDILGEYVGEYAFTPDSSFTFTRVGVRCFIQPTGQVPLETFASSETDFFLRQGQATVTFGRDDEGGPVTHLILHKVAGDQRADRVPQVAESADDETSIPDDMPVARSLFARHLEARGGRRALKMARTIEVRSKVTMESIGLEGIILSRFGPDMRFTSTIDMGAMGTTRQGYDGRVGWSISPQAGTEVLEGARLERLKAEANWLADAEYDVLYTRMQTVDQQDFHGFDCFVVEVTSSNGDESRIYFERETGRIRGRAGMATTAGGVTEVITVVHAYREFGGLLVPTRIEVIMPASKVSPILTVDAVAYDTLEMDAFERPSGIAD